MKTSWLIGLASLMVILTVVSGIIEQTYLGTEQTGTLWGILASFKAIEFSYNIFAVVGDIIVAVGTLVQGIWKMLTFDYAFFTGVWAIFRWLFVAIGVGVAVSLALAIRGTSSG